MRNTPHIHVSSLFEFRVELKVPRNNYLLLLHGRQDIEVEKNECSSEDMESVTALRYGR